MIPYSRQSIDKNDIESVIKTLKSDFLSGGSKIKEFEEAFAKKVSAKYAVACSSGTAALHLAYLTLGVKQFKEILVPSITFAGTANMVYFSGGMPTLVDVDSKGLMSPKWLKINKNYVLTNYSTLAIVPMHYSGMVCDMESIKKFANENNLKVVEDACHALGSTYANGSPVGCCKYSDMTVFSFHPTKAITTGEGGMVTTNSLEVYNKLIEFRNHGWVQLSNKKEMWKYENKDIGLNYRMSDINASLGLSQLKKLDDFIKKRKMIAKKYDSEFAKFSKYFEPLAKSTESSYHLYVIKLKSEFHRQKLFEYLRNNGVYCQVHYIPLYNFKWYVEHGYHPLYMGGTEDFYSKVISIPCYPSLTVKEQDKVISLIKTFFSKKHKKGGV